MLFKEKSLRDYLNNRLTENGCTDIRITNIQTFADGNLMADVSYTQKLNAWEKHAEHKDSIFVCQPPTT